MDQGSNMDDFPFTLTCSIRLICKWYHVFAIQTSIRNEFRVSKFYPLNPLKVHENGHGHWGPGCFEARQPQVASPHVERLLFILKSPIQCLVYDGLWVFNRKLGMSWCDVLKVARWLFLYHFAGLKCCRNSNPSIMTNVYYMFEVILIKKIQLKIKGASLRSWQLLHGRMPLWAWFYWRGLWCGILVKSFGESQQKWQVILMSSGYRKSWSTYMPGPATVYLLWKIWQWKMQYLSDAIKIYLYFMI